MDCCGLFEVARSRTAVRSGLSGLAWGHPHRHLTWAWARRLELEAGAPNTPPCICYALASSRLNLTLLPASPIPWLGAPRTASRLLPSFPCLPNRACVATNITSRRSYFQKAVLRTMVIIMLPLPWSCSRIRISFFQLELESRAALVSTCMTDYLRTGSRARG